MPSIILEGLEILFRDITQGLADLGKSIGNWFADLGTNIGNFFTNLLAGIIDFFAGIPEFFASFWDTLWEGVKALFTTLFVPSEDVLLSFKYMIEEKFSFIESIKVGANSIKNILDQANGQITLTLPLSSKYTGKFDAVVLDFSWYREFKTYGDLIITGFVYFMFVWRIFMNIPGIINGTSATVQTFSNNDLHLKNENWRWWIK